MNRIESVAREYWFELLIASWRSRACWSCGSSAIRRGPDDDPVVLDPGGGATAPAALRAPALPVRCSGCFLAPRSGADVRGRTADPVHRQLRPRGHGAAFLLGNLRDARKPAVGLAIVTAAGDRRLQPSGLRDDQLVHLHHDFETWSAGLRATLSASAPSGRRPRKCAQIRQSASGSRRLESPLRKSARASPASSMTSWHTLSASWCSRSEP